MHPFSVGGGNAYGGPQSFESEFNGKRPRAAVQRKSLDYNNFVMRHLHLRTFYNRDRDLPAKQSTSDYWLDMGAPSSLRSAASSVTTSFLHTSINKERYPVNCVLVRR